MPVSVGCFLEPRSSWSQNAPHTAAVVLDEEWNHPYSREQAAFPAAWVRQAKFWPAVSRVDNVYGEPRFG